MVANTVNADSGGGTLGLAEEKLKLLHPELFSAKGWKKFLSEHGYRLASQNEAPEYWKNQIAEYLRCGDPRAALVVSAAPLLVAAYAIELDCVALLRFDKKIARSYGLDAGKRLLAIDTYLEWNFWPPRDLDPGPAASGKFRNFAPLIADFLSGDIERIEQLKNGISDAEWNRVEETGKAYFGKFGPIARDGRPLLCHLPAKK